MPRQGKEHAVGPYKHGQKWRVVYIGANGVRETESYESEAEAIAERDAYNQAAGTRTVGEAVEAYVTAEQTDKSRETARFRLVGMLRLREGDRPLSAITIAEAKKLYAKRVEEREAATQHGELKYVKRFFNYAVKRGWVRVNPFAEIQQVGEANRGKPKLRVKETRTYLAGLLADPSMEATAVLTALTFSLRASAVVDRVVEDLDDDGWILWVRDSKTKASDMEIEVPAFLRERLVLLAAGKKPGEKLFVRANGEPCTRDWLHYHTVRLCKEVGVSRVTPHGLRGSGATNKVRSGEAIERVAKEIGHNDKGITLKRSYLGGGAIESGRARAIEELVMERPGSVSSQQTTEVDEVTTN